MSESLSIKDAFAQVTQRIHRASRAAQRSHETVQLLAVSKTFPATDIREAYTAAHHCAFGENYVQEGIAKIQALSDLRTDLTWHFIGPLQSNKTKIVAEHFDWVHSIDRLKIAQRLNEQRPKHMPPLNICIQINISQEDSKNGIHPAELENLIQQIAPLSHLRLRGLMSIPAHDSETHPAARSFQAMQNLFNTINLKHAVLNLPAPLDTLSMGMSADLESAIAYGSTLVRVGSALFGQRT